MKVTGCLNWISYFLFGVSPQLCGVRGGGNAAAQALFWQASKGVSFILAFESERERNAAIMLARRFAFDCNVSIQTPIEKFEIQVKRRVSGLAIISSLL